MSTQKSGEITVFLSLILTCVCALMCGLLESARVAASGWYLQTAADSALDSLMSRYHRDVWENYHLLLLEFDDEKGLEEEVKPYLSAYLKTGASYGLKSAEPKVLPPVLITSKKGEYLEEEITEYMKLGIFEMERDPGKLEDMWKDIREADNLGDITKTDSEDAKKVMALEKAVDNIGTSLKKQKEYLEQGKSKLKQSNGRGFISDAGRLGKELERMPGLVRRYEEEAEALAKEVEASRARAEEKRGNLSEETWQIASSKLESWAEYTDEEGARGKQIKALETQAADNVRIVEAAIEEAEDTLEYIEEWEAEDEDDELDEQELWDEVYDTVDRFYTDSSFTGSGIKDRKKMNVLEGISRLAEGNLLSLVMPEDRSVSAASVDSALFPSVTVAGGWSQTKGMPVSEIGNLLDTALVGEYTAHHFTNFLSGQEKRFQYEQEYILNGFTSDKENMEAMAGRIIKVREAMNLLTLLKDPQKRGEADALAAAITGAAGIAPLSKVVSFFILTVWAFSEALEDMRILLDGGKVPFIKSPKEWRVSLSHILERGVKTGAAGEGGGSTRGLDYQGYLKLFLLLQNKIEKNYRIMDMIQENIGQKQTGFLMEKCAFRIDMECTAKGRFAVSKRTSSKAY